MVPRVKNHSTETTSSSAGLEKIREWNGDFVQKDCVDIPGTISSPPMFNHFQDKASPFGTLDKFSLEIRREIWHYVLPNSFDNVDEKSSDKMAVSGDPSRRFAILRVSKALHSEVAQELDFLFSKRHVNLDVGRMGGPSTTIPGFIRDRPEPNLKWLTSARMNCFGSINVSIKFDEKEHWWWGRNGSDTVEFEKLCDESQKLAGALAFLQLRDSHWPPTTIAIKVPALDDCPWPRYFPFQDEGARRVTASVYMTRLLMPLCMICNTQPIELTLGETVIRSMDHMPDILAYLREKW